MTMIAVMVSDARECACGITADLDRGRPVDLAAFYDLARILERNLATIGKRTLCLRAAMRLTGLCEAELHARIEPVIAGDDERRWPFASIVAWSRGPRGWSARNMPIKTNTHGLTATRRSRGRGKARKTKACKAQRPAITPQPYTPVHDINVSHFAYAPDGRAAGARALPNPEKLAAGLAPRLAEGDKMRFVQTNAFDDWEWFIRFDEAMHRHGAPNWADAVTEPLYLGSVYLEHGYWMEHFAPVSDIVRGELSVCERYGVMRRWGNSPDYGYFSPGHRRVHPDRWEPRGDRFGGPYISFRDNRLGMKLADLALAEMAAEDHPYTGEGPDEADLLWLARHHPDCLRPEERAWIGAGAVPGDLFHFVFNVGS